MVIMLVTSAVGPRPYRRGHLRREHRPGDPHL